MPIPITCPGCSARMNAPDAAAGKKVKCPKCQTVLAVPAPVADVPAFEVVEDESPVEASTGRKGARKKIVVEDDEWPRRNRSRAAGPESESRTTRNVVVGVVAAFSLVITVGVVAGAVYYMSRGQSEDNAPANTSADPPAKEVGSGEPGSAVPNPSVDPPKLPEFREVRSFSLLGDGKRMVIGGAARLEKGADRTRENEVWVWDFRTQPLKIAPLSGPLIQSLVSPDGTLLAVRPLLQRKVEFFSLETNRVVKAVQLPSDAPLVGTMTFTEDGSALVLIDGGTVLLIRTDGTVAQRKGLQSPAREELDMNRGMTYVPALKRVVSLRDLRDTSGPELAAWDPLSDAPPVVLRLKDLSYRAASYTASADGKTIAVCSMAGHGACELTFHRTNDGVRTGAFPVAGGPSGVYSRLALSSDGRYLAGVTAGSRRCDLIRVADGRRLYRIDLQLLDVLDSVGRAGPVFSGDGKWLYFDAKGLMRRVATETGEEELLSKAP